MYAISVVYTTFSSHADAEACARTILEEKHAVCVNIIPGVSSLYLWQGEICTDQEVVAIFKTSPEKRQALMQRIKDLHTYTTPAVLDLVSGQTEISYATWLGTT